MEYTERYESILEYSLQLIFGRIQEPLICSEINSLVTIMV